MNIDDFFTRKVELENCGITLTFLQKEVGEVSCVIWDAALVLANYLDITNKKEQWLKGKKVLELGAGLGCAGLSAACLGSHVVLTDVENALPMLEINIKTNEKQWKAAGGIAEVHKLEWGKKNSLNFKPEIILLTDCVYYEESIIPLLDTLESLCETEKEAYAILSQELRDTPKQILVWEKFFSQLNQRFKIENIPLSQQHPTFSSPDILLMKIFKV